MNATLASSLSDFLGTWWGMTIFILIDIAVLVLIIALNYRWLFKRALDILFSIVFMAVFLPFFLIALIADAIYNKSQNAYPALFESAEFAGKKGKVIRMTVFATERNRRDAEGNLLPERQRVTAMGKILKACGMKFYPCLPAVFIGKLSFVGPAPMTLTDASAVGEDASVRFNVRPGLVSSLERYGGENLDWNDMFEEDAEYVEHINFFRDISFFMTKIANRLRGDTARKNGICGEIGYVDWLLKEGKIAAEDAAGYAEEGKAKLREVKRADKERRAFEEANFRDINRFK